MPWDVSEIVRHVSAQMKTPLGIHAHNDSAAAVANSLMAIQAGAIHIQGTINGIGERCGNANLISIIPALAVKDRQDRPGCRQVKAAQACFGICRRDGKPDAK